MSNPEKTKKIDTKLEEVQKKMGKIDHIYSFKLMMLAIILTIKYNEKIKTCQIDQIDINQFIQQAEFEVKHQNNDVVQQINSEIKKIEDIEKISQGLQDWDSQLQLLLNGVMTNNKKKEKAQDEKSPQFDLEKLKKEIPQASTSQIHNDLDEIDKELEELEKMLDKK